MWSGLELLFFLITGTLMTMSSSSSLGSISSVLIAVVFRQLHLYSDDEMKLDLLLNGGSFTQ